MRICRRLAALAPVVAVACNTCPFGIMDRTRVDGPIECCGAQVFKDIVVPTVDGLQVDMANASGDSSSRVDAFLTTTDCQQLFSGNYPGPGQAPLCRVLIGPVAAGTVSSRIKINPGTYRIVLQTWSTNERPSDYDVDVGMWGNSCRPRPTGF